MSSPDKSRPAGTGLAVLAGVVIVWVLDSFRLSLPVSLALGMVAGAAAGLLIRRYRR